MWDIIILNEIWVQGKIYILVDTLLALFCNLNFTKVCINLEKYVIHWLNFMSNPFILIYSGGGGIKFMKHFKGGRKH
jgi:hypothetical protein